MDSLDDFFNHPAHRLSEEAAGFAERYLRAGKEQVARELYAKAAKAELFVAKMIGEDGSAPSMRGIFALSAVALFLKAHKREEAQAAADFFLAAPQLLSSGALGEIKRLLAPVVILSRARPGPALTLDDLMERLTKIRESIPGASPVTFLLEPEISGEVVQLEDVLTDVAASKEGVRLLGGSFD